MAVYLAPDPFQSTFFIPGSNTPANGGQLFFYQAGSSTKQTVYKDSAGAVAWTNPIVLDSGGNIPLGNEVWFTGGVTYKVVFAPSTDSDPPVSPYWSKDNLSGMNDVTATASQEWVAGPTPTFVSATSFTCVGDQTAILTSGRRIKTTNTSGTVYSTINSATFGGGVTTVVVSNDQATVLDAGLAALSYALLSSIGPSVPLMADNYAIRSSSSQPFAKWRADLTQVSASTTIVQTIPNYSFIPQTQNIASTLTESSTVNLSTASGSFFRYPGTTAITQFTMFPGQDFTLQFASTCPLVYSASSLPLPGTVNITTGTGDVIILRGTSSGVGLPISYQSATGIPGAGSEVLLAQGNVLNTTNVDIIYSSAPYTTYRNKRLVLTNWIATVAAGALILRVSSTGGVNFESGTNAYGSAFSVNDNTGASGFTSNATTYMMLTSFFVGSGVSSGVNLDIRMYDTNASTHWQHANYQGSFVDSSATARFVSVIGGGARAASIVNNACRLGFTSVGSQVSSGVWSLYGYN